MNKGFEELLSIALKYKDNIEIFFIANVKDKTSNYSDYQTSSVTSEFLTEKNYKRIVDAMCRQGFTVHCYFDEEHFISDCVANDYYKNSTQQIIVINSAQKGTSIGRKSLIPSFCELCGFWYSGSNPYICSLARDKFKTNCILDNLGISCVKSYLYSPQFGWLLGQRPAYGTNVIVKLNYESSSIGLTHENCFLYNPKKDIFINTLAEQYRQSVIVQEFIEGYEIEYPYIKTKAFHETFPVVISLDDNIKMGKDILTYNLRKDRKYHFSDFRSINRSVAERLAECSEKVINSLGLEGLCRIDFRVKSNFEYFITDIATNPGYTEISSVKFAFSILGFNYEQLIAILIGSVIQKYSKDEQYNELQNKV